MANLTAITVFDTGAAGTYDRQGNYSPPQTGTADGTIIGSSAWLALGNNNGFSPDPESIVFATFDAAAIQQAAASYEVTGAYAVQVELSYTIEDDTSGGAPNTVGSNLTVEVDAGYFTSLGYQDTVESDTTNASGAVLDKYGDANSGKYAYNFQDVYGAGTAILTYAGERAVDALTIGDSVITAAGENRVIRWIWRRSYGGRFLAANARMQPVRFRAGCLGGGLPRRDLLVSPEHAMFIDGVLVAARHLVNGAGIVQERCLQRVDYFHVELDSHDILLAEGAPSESFLDDDSRGVFHNAADFERLYPDAPSPGGFCAPRLDQGFHLETIRRRLLAAAPARQEAA